MMVAVRYRIPFIAGLIVALLFTSLSSALSVRAAEPTQEGKESITLSPASQRYEFEAGETRRDKLTIINDGAVTYDFIVYARPYSMPSGAYDTPNFDATPPNADLYQWVQFDKTSYRLAPNESVEVNYTLRVPEAAAPGGHYGVLFAEIQPSSAQDGTSVIRKKRVGSIIYSTVKGDVRLDGAIEGTSVPFWQWRPPLSAVTTVNNSGNTDFLHKTQLTVSDVFGNVKLSQAGEQVVLPQTTRTVSLSWDDAPWFGLFKVDLTQTMLDNEPETHSGYVLLAPRWLVLVFVVSLIAGAVYVLLQRRR